MTIFHVRCFNKYTFYRRIIINLLIIKKRELENLTRMNRLKLCVTYSAMVKFLLQKYLPFWVNTFLIALTLSYKYAEKEVEMIHLPKLSLFLLRQGISAREFSRNSSIWRRGKNWNPWGFGKSTREVGN